MYENEGRVVATSTGADDDIKQAQKAKPTTTVLNAHQRSAVALIKQVMTEEIAANELILVDYAPESAEYKEAQEFLGQGLEALTQYLYSTVMFWAQTRTMGSATHLRFAGQKFICDRIRARLVSWGYTA